MSDAAQDPATDGRQSAPEPYEPPRADDVATDDSPSVTAAGGGSPILK